LEQNSPEPFFPTFPQALNMPLQVRQFLGSAISPKMKASSGIGLEGGEGRSSFSHPGAVVVWDIAAR
jgi:hypothetical protein